MGTPNNLSLIVAASENGVIGRQGDLPWRLPADLQHFKQRTMGHAIVMGRKTYASIGRLLPGRTTVIVSSNREYRVPGAVMARNWDEVWELVREDEQPFIVGGATIYDQALPWCRRVYLTRVHAEIAGDAFFHLPADQWVLISGERHRADARNEFDYSFEVYQRRGETDGEPWGTSH